MLIRWHGWPNVLACAFWCLPFHLVSDSIEPKEGDILQAVFPRLLNCRNSLPVYLHMELYPLTPCQVDFNELPLKKKKKGAFIVLMAVFGSWTVLSFFNERINISYSLPLLPLFQRSQKSVTPLDLLLPLHRVLSVSLICRPLDSEHLNHIGELKHIDFVAGLFHKSLHPSGLHVKRSACFPHFLKLFYRWQFDDLAFFSGVII